MPLAHAAVARNINIVVVVKNFSDGTVIEIDRGRFDDWCIYITGTCNRHAPKDVAYFTVVRGFGKRYGVDKVYADFISVYDKTSQIIRPVSSRPYRNSVERLWRIFKQICYSLYYNIFRYGCRREQIGYKIREEN